MVARHHKSLHAGEQLLDGAHDLVVAAGFVQSDRAGLFEERIVVRSERVSAQEDETPLERRKAPDDSGLAGYQVTFSQSATATLIGPTTHASGATSAASPTLATGSWFAHIAAVDNVGNWSSTATLGPVAVGAPAAIPTLSELALLALAAMLALVAALKLR